MDTPVTMEMSAEAVAFNVMKISSLYSAMNMAPWDRECLRPALWGWTPSFGFFDRDARL